MMKRNAADHLTKGLKIKLGGFYTPEALVDIVVDWIDPYIKANHNVVVFDNAAGCGAFVHKLKQYHTIASDFDREAYEFLKHEFDHKKIFFGNALKNVSRTKYHLSNDHFLINVGNPPYNDNTSAYKNGLKGTHECDIDLKDRDIGISFLKSYHKLSSDLVCILHPLSYLLKGANFKRLKPFTDDYRLKKGVIFSSGWFQDTGQSKFPILVALYEKHTGEGMDYESIREFAFDVLKSNRIFKLSDYQTSDDFIRKYPPRKTDEKISSIDTYYYTFRDLNSLKRNASFVGPKYDNAIVVKLENLYQYCYLYALKNMLHTPHDWIFGNLSPLADRAVIEKNKKNYVEYAIQHHPFLRSKNATIKHRIMNYYGIQAHRLSCVATLETHIKKDIHKIYQ